MEFPLAQRELTQAGRDRRNYIIRSAIAGLAVAILVVAWMVHSTMLMMTSAGSSGMTAGAEALGQALALTALVVQVGVTFIVAPMLTAGLVSAEKDEGTLGLLLMADLSGRDVFLAKYLRGFLMAELLLLSTLPFASFAALLGGVSVPNAVARLLGFSFYAAGICALGILYSTVSRRAATAFFLTVLSLIPWLGIGAAADAFVLYPIGFDNFAVGLPSMLQEFRTVNQALGIVLPQSAVAAVVGLAASGLAIRLLPGQVYASDAPRRQHSLARRNKWRRWLRVEPGERFVAAGASGFAANLSPWPLRVLAFVALMAIDALPCVGEFIVIALMSYDILSSMHAARRDGALDELVLTPLPDRALAQAIFRANFRAALFYGLPMVSVAFIGTVLTTVAFGFMGAGSLQGWLLAGMLEGPFAIGIRLATLLVSPLPDICFVLAMTGLLSYIGIQRGTPVQQTLLALLATVVLMIIVGLPTPFLSVFFTAVPAMGAPGGFTSYDQFAMLGSLLGSFIEAIGNAGAAILFFVLLAEGVRRHLVAQPQIYIATERR